MVLGVVDEGAGVWKELKGTLREWFRKWCEKGGGVKEWIAVGAECW